MLWQPLAIYLLGPARLYSRVYAQDFTVPSAWQNTVSNVSHADRLNFALEAAQEVTLKIDPSTSYPDDAISNILETLPNMIIALASQDWRNGDDKWKEPVDNILQAYESGHLNDTTTLDAGNGNKWNSLFGLAEVAAYLAYNDNARLAIAIRNFDNANHDFISASAARSGSFPRPINTSASCGSTLGGALFVDHLNPNNLAVVSSAAGPWTVLSARLYELTRDSQYLGAAEQSIQFMSTYLIKLSGTRASVAGSSVDVTSCTVAGGDSFHGDDVGPYIEALSIVANVTGNGTYTAILYALVQDVVTYDQWQSSDGINTEALTYCTRGYLMRGLLEARLRNPSNSALLTLIDSYLTVQFNAVRSNALVTSSNDYSIYWTAGANASVQYNTVGSIEALDVLNAALVITPSNSNVSAAPTNPTSSAYLATNTRPLTHSSALQQRAPSHIGAIVGAIAGIVAGGVIILALYTHLRRRRSARASWHDGEGSARVQRARLIPNPFTLAGSPQDRRAASTPEKSRRRMRKQNSPEPQLQAADTSDEPLNPFRDIVNDAGEAASVRGTASAPNRPAAGDSDALQTLAERSMIVERRLDGLFHSLATIGDSENSPPEYDGSAVNHPSGAA